MWLTRRHIVLGVAFLASVGSMAAMCGDQDVGPTPRAAVTTCSTKTAACMTAERTGEPTPSPVDPEGLAILRNDPAIKLLLGGLTAGRDYWLGFDGPFAKNERGERLEPITIIFREEFHFAGKVPLFSDPFSGI